MLPIAYVLQSIYGGGLRDAWALLILMMGAQYDVSNSLHRVAADRDRRPHAWRFTKGDSTLQTAMHGLCE